MNSEEISIKEAQRLILASQKLIGPPLKPLQVIEHLGYVQIDTISVVERAHHHVFWTRCPDYKPSDLENLVRSRKVFEHWSHAASYLPMKDYRYSIPLKKEFSKKENSWFPKDPKTMKMVLKRIKEEGPLRSKDFQNIQSKKSGWWDWKPAKKALERLFLEGKLEISKREGFQKVYDLPERVIPSSVNTSPPTTEEYIRYLIKRTLRHHGLATTNEIGYLQKKNVKNEIHRQVNEMLHSGEIIQISVQKLNDSYYALPSSMGNLPRLTPKILILSPFDNLVIQRKKLQHFFDFNYQIECYVPESKRKYGYFALPIFYGAKGMARVDCKTDRKNKSLIVQSIHYEKNVDSKLLRQKIKPKLKSFAKFNNCNNVVF